MPADWSPLAEALGRASRVGMIGGDLDAQLAHCRSFSTVVARVLGAQHHFTAVDLGTGGGLPGLPLAFEWESTHWTLIDRRAGRATEVERAAQRLGLGERVTVAIGEVQHWCHRPTHRGQADLVVARSFGPPSVVAECGAPLLRLGGVLVVSEPPEPDVDRWPVDALTRCGLGPPAVENTDGGHRFVVMAKVGPSPSQLPRLPARNDRGWP